MGSHTWTGDAGAAAVSTSGNADRGRSYNQRESKATRRVVGTAGVSRPAVRDIVPENDLVVDMDNMIFVPPQVRVHHTVLTTGIARTKEFEKKGLAEFSVNVGTKCGHDCSYCSTGAMLRMHPAFRKAGEDPFGTGFAIVDPSTPERVAADAKRIKVRGLIQLCTTVDAWAPEAQEHGLGRRCLEAILSEPGWTFRILTKNAAVLNDFDLIERHRDRVLVGISLTATESNANLASEIEPNASTIRERRRALRIARPTRLHSHSPGKHRPL